MSEPTSATAPVRVTRMSVDVHSSTDDTIRVMAELSPPPA